MDEHERQHVLRAKRRLDSLSLYPSPVVIGRVRVLSSPWLFRIPGFRRFFGYEVGPLILVRRPLSEVSNDLVTHELTHVWQDQHVRLAMWRSYLPGWLGGHVGPYRENPFEREARAAVEATRDIA